MSKLFLANQKSNWQLNVTSFSSPIYGQLASAQTKKMAMHFPIRATQPEMQFNVQFDSEKQFENFQRFVRAHHQDTLVTTNLVWLNWPERNIDNKTGVITKFQAGGKRFNPAPKASFTVQMVDSMVSARTELSAIPELLWRTIYGAGMGPDAILGLPTAIENILFYQNPRFSTSNGTLGAGTGLPGVNPAQPGFGPAGITAGS